jgi:hypothetical protein
MMPQCEAKGGCFGNVYALPASGSFDTGRRLTDVGSCECADGARFPSSVTVSACRWGNSKGRGFNGVIPVMSRKTWFNLICLLEVLIG